MHQPGLYLPPPPITSRHIPPARHGLPSAGPTSAWSQSLSNPAVPKKRNVERACDDCRRRKTRCDGPKMPDNVCTNCVQNRKMCTYMLAQSFFEYVSPLTPLSNSEASKPRGPPKAFVVLGFPPHLPCNSYASYSYVTSLEDRMEKMEALLKRVRMASDFEQLKPPHVRFGLCGPVTRLLQKKAGKRNTSYSPSFHSLSRPAYSFLFACLVASSRD